MNKLIESLEKLLSKETLLAVIYFRLKNGEVKLADIEDNVLPQILNLYKNEMEKEIIKKEDLELLNLSEADERKNVIYKYDFDKEQEPFLSINAVANDEEISKFSFSKDTLGNIDAIIAKIGNAEESMYLYSKFYPVNLIEQGKVIKLIKSDHRFKMFTDQLIQITGKFDIIKYSNEYYIKKYEILEKFYQFENVIQERTKNDFKKIEKLGIIENESKLFEYLENKPSRARKFIKAMASSKVIQKNIPNDRLISFVTNNSKLKGNIKTNDDENKFVLDTNKSCDFFIKLLDDDFLKSELTQEEYDAIAKNNI